MRRIGMIRVHRLVKNNFGNYRNFFAWCLAVALAVYVIDYLITPRVNFPKTRHSRGTASETSSIRTLAAEIGDEEQEQEQEPLAAPAKQAARKKSIVHNTHCGLAAECPRGKFSYFVKSGYGRDQSAVMCFNENYIIAEDKVTSDRGLNMVVINDATLNAEEIKVFDVYSSDAELISYLRSLNENFIILVASHDEASFNLTSVGRKEMMKFGSVVLNNVNFRDNYVIVGQKGLAPGQAIEAHQPRPITMQFAETAVVSGCLSIPVGKTEKEMAEKAAKQGAPQVPVEPVKKADRKPAELAAPVKDGNKAPKNSIDVAVPEKPKEKAAEAKGVAQATKDVKEAVKKDAVVKEAAKKNVVVNGAEKEAKRAEMNKKKVFKEGEEQLNCGVTTECTDGFPVHLYTGLQAKELPKICVNGKYVLADGLNDAGRGLNFVVVDPKTKEVVRVARFDTYSADDNTLELFIEMLNDGDIVLGVAHDEASHKLEKSSRELLETLGSSFISQLAFRDVWTFVGQKGIVGFSPFESFEFSDADAVKMILSWPRAIDKHFCVPTKLKALPARRILVNNMVRKNFCKKHDGYGEFCDKDNIDKPLEPVALSDESLEKDLIFTIPVVIISGLEYNSVRRQLEGLFANPGMKKQMIVVFFDEKFEEAGDLATVFNVSSHKLASSIKYTELMDKAIKESWKMFPNANHLIVLEEEVFPSTDFLNFFRQGLPALEADDTLAGISAWNDNAYQGRAGIRNIAYRTSEALPGFGFLLKRSFYEEQIKDRMAQCCMRRAWEGWITTDMTEFEMIVPDVSRVERGQYNGRMTDLLRELFQRPRESIGQGGSSLFKLLNADDLESEKYEADLNGILGKARPANETELRLCLSDKNFRYDVNNLIKGPYAVYFEQETTSDDKILSHLCRCFGLFHVPGYKVRNVHRGIVRFSHGDQMAFLIGSKTEYFVSKPSNVEPLRIEPSNAKQ